MSHASSFNGPELVVQRTLMRKTNHKEVASLVSQYDRADSDQAKYEIQNELGLHFLNVGGLAIRED